MKNLRPFWIRGGAVFFLVSLMLPAFYLLRSAPITGILLSKADAPLCGDSFLDEGEQCDDGNANDGDGCSALCVTEYCGDEITNNVIETCDDGVNNGQPNQCNASCDGTTESVCGNSVIELGETCDDGLLNGLPNQCNATCDDTTAPICGNEILESGETCDPPGSTEMVNFTKSDYGDEEDCITENVCLTRGDRYPIYNSVTDDGNFGGDAQCSWRPEPTGTEWAVGTCDDHGEFDTFYRTYGGGGCLDGPGPQSLLNEDLCLHLTEDNLYFDIKFTSWSSDGNGGGFSYTRSSANVCNSDCSAYVVPPSINQIEALLQDGDEPSAVTNNWYYYSTDQDIRFVLTSDRALSIARACVKPLSDDDSASTCADSDFTGGIEGVDYVNYTNDLGENSYEFIIPISDYGLPTDPGGYPISLYLVDEDEISGHSTSQSNSFGAVFGINPSQVAPLDNEDTTDWSTIDDFTSVGPLVFSAQAEEMELGRITLGGPLNLTAQATINALINLGDNMTVGGDEIRIDTDSLSAFDGNASLLMHVDTEGVQPGLVVRDNTGAIQGYVGKDDSGEIGEVGDDVLDDLTWDGENGNLTFTTSGFSEFDTDYTPPTVEWARIIDGNQVDVAFSEPVESDDPSADFTDFRITGEESARDIVDWNTEIAPEIIRLYFDGDSVPPGATGTIDINNPPLSVTDMVGNELALVDDMEVEDGQEGISTVYVDDSWTGAGNSGGHIWGYDAFDNIQDGIDAIGEGGTVNVAAGTYDEEISINTDGITLTGDVGNENAGPGEGAPIINDESDCESRTVNINADDVTVEGFFITSECNYPTIRVANEISGAQVLDNDISNNYTGIGLSPYSSESTVMRNLLHDNDYGMTIGGSQNNTISDNDIYSNSNNGIYFKCGGEGDCDYGDGSAVSDNNIHDNANAGIYFDYLDNSETPVLIQSNTIDSNGCYGIYIDSDVTGVSILGNDITDNGLECEDTGIYTYSVNQIAIHGNTITGNDDGVINNAESVDSLDATRNYWGAEDGPSGEGPGEGDSVGSNVIYDPWYTDAEMTTLSDEAEIPVTDLSPIELNIPSDVNDASVDVNSLLDGGLSGEIPQITFNSTTTIGNVTVAIPSGTTATGDAGWTGEIHAPTVKANSSVTITGGTVASVIEVGFDDIAITFDKGVRILIAGQGGKRVGYSRSGVFTEITSTCAADDQATGDALAAGADCKITVGGDMVIWTKHFTSFATYTTSGSTPSGDTSSSNIGGGYSFLLNNPNIRQNLKKNAEGISTTPLTQAVSKFTDLKNHWALSYVNELVNRNAAIGITATTFVPDTKMTRGALVQMVVLAFKIPISSEKLTQAPFSDVGKNDSSVVYLQAAKDAGVIQGYGDGTFRPDQTVNRAEAIKIILTASKASLPKASLTFNDTSLTAWYANYVSYAKKRGIVTGFEQGTFKPAEMISRGEAAKLMALTLRKLGL